MITSCAKRFIALYDNAESADMRAQAEQTRVDLQKFDAGNKLLAKAENSVRATSSCSGKLALYFSQDSLAMVIDGSYETSRSSERLSTRCFCCSSNRTHATPKLGPPSSLRAFHGYRMLRSNMSREINLATPFGVSSGSQAPWISLSRSEHFEVRTVQHNTYDNSRGSPANMLAKQVRIKLSAEEDSGITNFRETQVTVHALATIKSLGDFLRPRLSLPVPERGSRSHRDSPFRREFPTALAACAAAIHRRDPASFPPIPAPSDITNRMATKRSSGSKNAENTQSPATPSASAPVDAQASLRRSRRHAQPPLPPPAKDEGESLDCADEKQISSDEEMDEEAALNAIVGRLEEEMDDEEPSAVNLEVAPTGKVTARKRRRERGFRHPALLQRPPAAQERFRRLVLRARRIAT